MIIVMNVFVCGLQNMGARIFFVHLFLVSQELDLLQYTPGEKRYRCLHEQLNILSADFAFYALLYVTKRQKCCQIPGNGRKFHHIEISNSRQQLNFPGLGIRSSVF